MVEWAPSGLANLSLVERLSSFRGDFLYKVCMQETFGMSFVGRFVLLECPLYCSLQVGWKSASCKLQSLSKQFYC